VERALGRMVEQGLERSRADGEVIGAARYALEAGGKRLRPILCATAYRAVAGDAPEAAYDLAASLEIIHTYSLVHDDLPSMDDDAVRRGRPATHIAFGVATATVAGAALIPLAARVALEACDALGLEEARAGAAVATLMAAAGAGGMVGGQALDLAAEGRRVSLDELEGIHRLKTGALLAAAAEVGGIAAGAGVVARNGLVVYGRALGLAFQIVDDILDVTGSTVVLGKTAGRDTELEKATYPGLAGVEGARERARAEAERARAALREVGLASPELEALARYAVERDR
jgi:geranylgeranyl diphosphate synthase, type II